MTGETTKFYKYPTESSGRVTIPISIAKVLNWEHKDELTMVTATLDNQIGLFIFKKGGSYKLNSDTHELEKVKDDKIKKRNKNS